MYMVRKRFMYWQVPATTKVFLGDDKKQPYCFVPARLVKKLEKALNHIQSLFVDPVAKTLRDRKVNQL